MYIDLSKIKGHIGKSLDVNYNEDLYYIELNNNKLKVNEPIKVIGNIENGEEGIKINLHVTGSIIAICDRCLDEFAYNIDIPVVEILSNNDDEYSTEIKDEKLDLTKVVKENIVLSFPMKFICSQSCKGLCPICGKNLNHETCDCHQKGTDSRLSILSELLRKM